MNLMENNSNKPRGKGKGRPQNQRQGKSGQKGRRKRGKEDARLAGFTTLRQVSGVPKPHSFHSRISVPEGKLVREPLPKCPYCGQVIEGIAQAITGPDGEIVHFNCALERVASRFDLKGNQKVSYVGKGAFALCEKDAEGKWTILERVQFESHDAYSGFKTYVEEMKV